MLLKSYGLLYLHVPKTGGNSISRLLLPYSSDHMVTSVHQEGVDRFELRGPDTPHKHATLGEYSRELGAKLKGFKVAISVRDPLDRAISYYFSPHRWMRRRLLTWAPRPPHWSLDDFKALLPKIPTVASFLRLDGEIRLPDHVVRFEHLADDLAAVVDATGIPADLSKLTHVNRSVGNATQLEAARADPLVSEAVKERFADDYELAARMGLWH